MEFDSKYWSTRPDPSIGKWQDSNLYDPVRYKNSPIHNRPRDMGQRITGLAEGAIESMHNLPVSLAGSKLSDGINGRKLLSMRFQSSQVVLMQKKQRFMKFRSIQVQWQQ